MMILSFFFVIVILATAFANVENHHNTHNKHQETVVHQVANRDSPLFKKFTSHLSESFTRAKTQFPAGQRPKKKKEFRPYDPALATKTVATTSDHQQPHLRTTGINNVETEAWSGKVSGWFEEVLYNPNWYKPCKHPYWKENFILNTCGWSQDYGVYTMITATADQNSHMYTTTQYLYSSTDSTCSQTPWSYYVDDYPILICEAETLFHVRKSPINPETDNMKGFAMGVFDTQANCLSGSANGLLDAAYQKLNLCWQSDDGDFLYSSCSNTSGLVMDVYASTDGTCTGSYTSYNYAVSDYCLSSDAALSWFGGWSTFVCEPPNN